MTWRLAKRIILLMNHDHFLSMGTLSNTWVLAGFQRIFGGFLLDFRRVSGGFPADLWQCGLSIHYDNLFNVYTQEGQQ